MRTLFVTSLLGTALLTGLFVSVRWREDATLENSLVDLSIIPPISRHAVLVEGGTILEGTLSTRTLAPGESPYLLRGVVSIPSGVTIRAEPGTTILATEGAQLIVEGTFEGTSMRITSNHLHPRRRLWHGVVARDGGSVVLHGATLMDATAALACARGGVVDLAGGVLSSNAAGVVTLAGSVRCRVADTEITDGRVGLHLVGGNPTVSRVTFERLSDGLRIYHEARPHLARLAVRHLSHAAIVYAATPDLAIRGLDLPAGSDSRALILDGEDAPAHRWGDAEYPTGRVKLL